MSNKTQIILQNLFERYAVLEPLRENIKEAFYAFKECFLGGRRLFLCGNGGSAADCEHIVGELVKSFKKRRPLDAQFEKELAALGEEGAQLRLGLQGGLPAVSLCGHPALSTAFSNDCNPYFTFAQQVGVYGQEGDALMVISTSGNSKNCIYAALAAKAKKMKTILLGGGTGGKLKEICDISIIVGESETYKVQELHLPVYHCLCAMFEEELF